MKSKTLADSIPGLQVRTGDTHGGVTMLRQFVPAIAILALCGGIAAEEGDAKPKTEKVAKAKTEHFVGKVSAVDVTAKAIVVTSEGEAPKSATFAITDTTKVTVEGKKAEGFELAKVEIGTYAAVDSTKEGEVVVTKKVNLTKEAPKAKPAHKEKQH
jgi:hypothetical protein